MRVIILLSLCSAALGQVYYRPVYSHVEDYAPRYSVYPVHRRLGRSYGYDHQVPAYGSEDKYQNHYPVYAPEPAYKPEPSYIPEPVYAPEPSYRPEPSYIPEPVYAPEPSYRPEPSYIPEPVYVPEPSYIPEPVYAPEPVYRPEHGLVPRPVPGPATPGSVTFTGQGVGEFTGTGAAGFVGTGQADFNGAGSGVVAGFGQADFDGSGQINVVSAPAGGVLGTFNNFQGNAGFEGTGLVAAAGTGTTRFQGVGTGFATGVGQGFVDGTGNVQVVSGRGGRLVPLFLPLGNPFNMFSSVPDVIDQVAASMD